MVNVVRLVAEGVGTVREMSDLARRAESGEVITAKEIKAVRKAVSNVPEKDIGDE